MKEYIYLLLPFIILIVDLPWLMLNSKSARTMIENIQGSQMNVKILPSVVVYIALAYLATIPKLNAIPNTLNLDMSHNKVEALNSEFLNKLPKLITLNLSNNEISEISEEVDKLLVCQNLFLDSNKLTSLPNSFTNLETLRILNIKNNNLQLNLIQELKTKLPKTKISF